MLSLVYPADVHTTPGFLCFWCVCVSSYSGGSRVSWLARRRAAERPSAQLRDSEYTLCSSLSNPWNVLTKQSSHQFSHTVALRASAAIFTHCSAACTFVSYARFFGDDSYERVFRQTTFNGDVGSHAWNSAWSLHTSQDGLKEGRRNWGRGHLRMNVSAARVTARGTAEGRVTGSGKIELRTTDEFLQRQNERGIND